jgi:hypothetical protein
MARASLIAIAFALVLAGCGGDHAAGPSYTSEEVIDHFKRETGYVLVRRSDVPPGLEALNTERDTELGAFTIFVVSKDPEANVRRLLKSAPGAKTEAPNAEGIYWTRVCPPKKVHLACFFVAQKRFGSNVLLNWVNTNERETDGSFDRLSQLLAGLAH